MPCAAVIGNPLFHEQTCFFRWSSKDDGAPNVNTLSVFFIGHGTHTACPATPHATREPTWAFGVVEKARRLLTTGRSCRSETVPVRRVLSIVGVSQRGLVVGVYRRRGAFSVRVGGTLATYYSHCCVRTGASCGSELSTADESSLY
eukprot:1437179-Rhodomonas_salina.4